MNWIELDKEDLPEEQVLAANFSPGTYGYKEKIVGFLYWDDDNGFIACEAEGTVLENCTHYIDLSKFDI